MSMIEIELDDREVLDYLHQLQQRTGDITPALGEIGEYLIKSTKERFGTGTAPDGTPWAKNSDLTLSRKEGTQPLIGETKRLSTEFSYFIGNNELTFGSPLEYAAIHQFGVGQGESGRGSFKTRKGSFPIPWGDIPARPFIGISDSDQMEILDIISGYLSAE
jgi:phage virion morphogenesis protein